MTEEYLRAVQNAELPEQEKCETGAIPEGVASEDGTKVIVPEVETITKFLFKRYKNMMRQYLNKRLSDGSIERLAGVRVLNRRINAQTSSFPHVTYWRVDREHFLADIDVALQLQTVDGIRKWDGCLTLWCGFEDADDI